MIVEVTYQTAPGAPALQWLTPQQTAGKKQPYLFSQCQVSGGPLSLAPSCRLACFTSRLPSSLATQPPFCHACLVMKRLLLFFPLPPAPRPPPPARLITAGACCLVRTRQPSSTRTTLRSARMPAPTDKRQRHAVCVCVSLAGVGAQRLGGSHERRARRSGRGPAGRRSRDLPLQTERRPARRPLSLSVSVSLSLGFLRPKPRLPCVSFAARQWPPIIWLH